MKHQSPTTNKEFRSQAKAMALVLSAAFIISTAGAALVSLMVKGCYGSTAAAHCATAPTYTTAAHVSLRRTGGVTPIYSAEGATANSYSWTYSGDSDCALVRCDYDSGANRYTFSAEGIHAGTDHVQLLYKTDENNWETRAVTIRVDNNLRVSVVQDKP